MQLRSALLPAIIVLSGCAGLSRPAASVEIFDEQSGNTLSVVSSPLVFARERTDVAAHARDYVTLVAIEIDHSGAFSDYLLLYRWSTVDRRMSAPPDPQAGALRILAAGRAIDLRPLDGMPVDLSKRRELYVPNHGTLAVHAYQVDAATLRFIASSQELYVRLPQEALDTPFKLWEDGRAALAQFAGRAGSL